jgi:hypothetical protein
MKTTIITATDEGVLLAPVKEPIAGWDVRPGTFRVAQAYDKSIMSNAELPTTTIPTTEEPDRPNKKQKLSTVRPNNDKELAQWIQSTLQLLMQKASTQTYIASMQQDNFYGTCVDAPANEEFTLDLVKAQPTLQMLRHGFQSTSTSRRRNQEANDENAVEFEEIQLDSGNPQQLLEMTDVYEMLVTNQAPKPAFVTFPTEGQPRYLIPPLSAFVASDFNSIQGLKSIGKSQLPCFMP